MADYTVEIADMRTRITLQEPTIVTDAGRAQSTTWANVTTTPTVWARWINAHGQEYVASEAAKSAQRATVTIRYRSDLLPTWRVLKDSEAWQIISIDPVQDRNRYVELVVERVKGTL